MDIWAMADAGIGVETSDKGSSSSSSTPTPNSNEIEDSSTILIVGDAGCGKSSLIQSFLKPNSNKEPKSTFALEYCFAKRKNASNSDKDGKTLAHIWELGGDIYEPKLLTIPLSTVTLPTSAVIICLDLSKPQDCFLSLKRWLSTIREHLAARFSELRASGQTSQIHAQAMRERALGAYGNSASPHIDANCVKPCEVPIFVVANKNDLFRNKHSSADRRTLLQILRFACHYHGASFVVTSATESGSSSGGSSSKEAFRLVMNHLCFGVPIKPTCDVAVDRPVFVTAGMDSFHTILIGRGTGKGSEAGIGDNKAQSSLATTDSDVATYITSSTVNKETWGRFETTLVGVYGAPDPEAGRGKSTAVSTGSRVGEEGGGSAGVEAAIEYPEDDIDEARSSRNMALEQYIQDAARREKMSARSGLSSDMGSGTGTGNNDDEDEGMGGGRKVSGRSAGNSKNDLSTLDRDRDRDARDRDRDARDNNSNSNIKSNSTAYNQESEFDDRRNGRARK